jgi:hypothetical protein
VRAAHAAGLPLGDLPALTRQLHAGAQAVDAALAAGPVGRGGDDLRRQARELTALADELAAAVSVAAAGDTRPATDRLVTQLRDELTAVRHGWRAGSSA